MCKMYAEGMLSWFCTTVCFVQNVYIITIYITIYFGFLLGMIKQSFSLLVDSMPLGNIDSNENRFPSPCFSLYIRQMSTYVSEFIEI